jgi:hypothetical protein
MDNAISRVSTISENFLVVCSSKCEAAQAGQTWAKYLLINQNKRYPDSAPTKISIVLRVSNDSGRSVKAAAPNNAPAEKEINLHSFL